MSMKYWFKGKKYGYGWYPSTWQGWLMIVVYFTVFGFFVRYWLVHVQTMNVWLYLAGVFSLTGILVYISWKKGEPTHWRWGK